MPHDPGGDGAPIAEDCSSFAPCAGDITVGTYAYTGACLFPEEEFRTLPLSCSILDLSTLAVSGTVDGIMQFTDTQFVNRFEANVTAEFAVPFGCHSCDCPGWAEAATHSGVTVTCDPTCNSSDECLCTANKTVRVDEVDGYRFNDIYLVSDRSWFVEYCSDGQTLSFSDQSTSPRLAGVFELELQSSPGFEVCDGVDNDGNGTADDAALDCPPACITEGVCGEGSTSTCTGLAGWECSYTSPDYEPVEVTCDGLDNDCNGQTDEVSGCCSDAAECDDGDDCTTDSCVASGCRNELAVDADADGYAPLSVGACGTDCFDGNADVWPDQPEWFTVSYTDSAGAPSFDYNCDGVETQHHRSTASGGCTMVDPPRTCTTCERSCSGSGWTGAVPECGQEGDYRSCYIGSLGGCVSDTVTRPQECR